MSLRTFSTSFALCGVLAAGIPATALAGPTSREVLDFYVTTVFDNCVKAVQERTEVSYDSLKKAFVLAGLKDPNELTTRTGLQFALYIRGHDNHACMFIAQNGAADNRVIAQLLREKLQAAHAERDEPSLISRGESWRVPASDPDIAARVTLEMAWDDAFLVLHFLDQSSPSPTPVPQVPPPPLPPSPPR